jgi:hypothetical protein
MNTEKTIFETGATSAAVNELILYTDNTRELSATRDNIYTVMIDCPDVSFRPLWWKAMSAYKREFRKSIFMDMGQINEYCQIYANRFPEWKKERERNPQ